MINRVAGDTLLYRKLFLDDEGTAVTTGVASLTLVDFTGSTVFDGTATHAAAGTWKRNIPSDGFNKGPIAAYWNLKAGAGTFSFNDANDYRIVGTETVKPYVYAEELSNWYENIGDYHEINHENKVVEAFNDINSKLESLGHKMPIRAKDDGFHDQVLRDWNALEAIVRIVSSRQSSFNRDDDKPWFSYFQDQIQNIYKKVSSKVYVFARDYSPAEAGVGKPTKTVGTSPGQMETNWRIGLGNGFSDPTFERDWVVEIIGTGTVGGVNDSLFRWSRDGGMSYGTSTTSFEWQELRDEVHVRFHRGTEAGTENIFHVNDKWTFKTFPKNQTSGGKKSARSY